MFSNTSDQLSDTKAGVQQSKSILTLLEIIVHPQVKGLSPLICPTSNARDKSQILPLLLNNQLYTQGFLQLSIQVM